MSQQALSVEKIGGTSMSEYQAVRDNIILYPENPYNRIFVVSAYGGMTDKLLEHKKTGQPGVYALFAAADENAEWKTALELVGQAMVEKNRELFTDEAALNEANNFILQRIVETQSLLTHLQDLCRHGHFSLESHLLTVRELLASIGEAHSAYNLAHLLQGEGVNALFVDMSGWQAKHALPLDEMIISSLSGIDFRDTLPIVTGYTHCAENLMHTFDRGYSEMTFSRVAVLVKATEAVIHKEYHLSSADPRLVGESNVVPIGRTNYDIADQLANLGMEAIHPKAAKGLRQAQIPLRIMNTFEPEHHGTLISKDYQSETPRVEIIAGMPNLMAIEIFDQEMMGQQAVYEMSLIKMADRLNCQVISKDFNANTITVYLQTSLNKAKEFAEQFQTKYPTATINTSKIAMASAMGSDMRIKGLLATAVQTLSEQGVNIEALHQNTRQVEMQFYIKEDDYELTVRSLHQALIEVHNHGKAICEH